MTDTIEELKIKILNRNWWIGILIFVLIWAIWLIYDYIQIIDLYENLRVKCMDFVDKVIRG